MREGVSVDAEQRLYDELARVRAALADHEVVDRALATLLALTVVHAFAAVDSYSGDERKDVEESVATIGEAVIALLTPDDMPPLPHRF
jgi:hypothetical protein